MRRHVRISMRNNSQRRQTEGVGVLAGPENAGHERATSRPESKVHNTYCRWRSQVGLSPMKEICCTWPQQIQSNHARGSESNEYR